MRASLAATLRVVLLLAIPASLGLVLLRVPLVQVLYQRGQFDSRSTQMVAWALLWYAAGLVGHALVEILSRAFYALHDTRTPVSVGVITMGLNIGLSILFSVLFVRLGWMPHGGLALANSLSTALESAALLLLMRKRLSGLQGRQVWIGVAQSLLATGLMSLAILLWQALTGGHSALLLLGGGLLLGLLVYTLLLWLLKVPELRRLLQVLKDKIKK